MKTQGILLILVLCTIVPGSGLAQEKVYFPYFELINVESDAQLQYSTSRLLKTYIEDNHDTNVLLPEWQGTYYTKETFLESLKNAEAFSATHVLLGEIHSLGSTYIVSLGLYEVRTGNKVWHDLIKGKTTKDLDPLLSRLGRTFGTHQKAKLDAEIDETTEFEQQGIEVAQITVNHFVGVLIGGNYIFGEHTSSGFGLAYSYDATSVIFNLNFEFYPSSSILASDDNSFRRFRTGNFNLGVLVPLSRKKMTWYLGGGMEYGVMNVRREEPFMDKTNTGVGFYVGGGYLINRNSTINLRIHVAAVLPTYTLDGESFPGFKFGLITSFSKPGK